MEFLTKPEPLEISDDIKENWEKFKRRWNNYAIGAEITEKSATIQKAIFLNLIGSEAEELINSLALSDAQSKTVELLIKAIDDYVKPRTNVVFSRYQFFTRSQKEGEDFETFLLALKKLAENCGFGDLKTSLIRDRIIIGVSNQELRQRMLGEEYDFERTVKLCRSVESGKLRAKEINNQNTTSASAEINWVSKPQYNNNYNRNYHKSQPTSSSSGTSESSKQQGDKDIHQTSQPPTKVINCRNCAQKHGLNRCPAFRKQCNICKRLNHFSSMCRSRDKIASSKSDVKTADLVNIHNQCSCSSANVANHSEISDINASDYVYVSEISVQPFKFDQFAYQSSNFDQCAHQANFDQCAHQANFDQCAANLSNSDQCANQTNFDQCAGNLDQLTNQPNISQSAKVYKVFNISQSTEKCWMEKLIINNNIVEFKLDSGAEVNILPRQIFDQIKISSNVLLPNRSVVLGYGGAQIDSSGHVVLDCKLPNQNCTRKLFFTVVNIGSTPLLGLRSCVELGFITRNYVNNVFKSKEQVINDNSSDFKGLGTFPDKCDIKIDPNAIPISDPPRRLPVRLLEKLKRKLAELVMFDIISPDTASVKWFSNLVIVEKKGKIRLCLDPKNLNKVIQRDFFLIPSFEEIKPKLKNKKIFSVSDVKDGFWHCQLTPEASDLCGFHTPFGSFKFLRMPFGLMNAPEVFQKHLTKYFGDIPNVIIYFDDILICGETNEEHDIALAEVLKRARKYNIKFNCNKFQFKQSEIRYMGHLISGEGIRPDDDYLKAIRELEIPKTRKQLQSVLGTINYIRDFVPNLADLIEPFRNLLKKNTKFVWTPGHTEHFNKIKEAICNVIRLHSFDPAKNITIQSDASKFGLGACLFQEGRPVAFASRSLTDAETRYAQIEKEMLSIVFALKKFHNLVYGFKFKIRVQNDHKPLEAIFTKNIAKVMSNRLQCLLLKIIAYDLNVKYLPGKKMYVADMLSRNFIKTSQPEDEINLEEIVHCLDVNFQIANDKYQELKNATLNDPLLTQSTKMHLEGWERCHDDSLQPYFKIRNELAINDGVLFFRNRLIIPSKLQLNCVKLLHGEAHLGISKVIERAKLICYWPGFVTDIENYVKSCNVCNKFQPKNVKEPYLPHPVPAIPFHKLGADIAQLQNKNYLIVTDYFSKWLEIK